MDDLASEIAATALETNEQHGASAAYFAANRADELLEPGAHDGAATWRAILATINRLQAMEPKGNAR